MPQNGKSDTASLVTEIKKESLYFIPPGGLTTELHLAAFLKLSRRTVIDNLFHPVDEEGVPCYSVGPRKVCSSDAVVAFLQRVAKPQQRPRRKGRN